MIFVGVTDCGFDDLILDNVVVFDFEYPMDVLVDDRIEKIKNEEELAEWADGEFTEWEVRGA